MGGDCPYFNVNSYLCLRMKKEEVLEFLVSQKESLFRNFQLQKLGLFGSAARSENANDLDIIIEFEPNTQNLFDKKFQIQELLEQKFKAPVDICREKFIKPSARNLIMKDAIFV